MSVVIVYHEVFTYTLIDALANHDIVVVPRKGGEKTKWCWKKNLGRITVPPFCEVYFKDVELGKKIAKKYEWKLGKMFEGYLLVHASYRDSNHSSDPQEVVQIIENTIMTVQLSQQAAAGWEITLKAWNHS